MKLLLLFSMLIFSGCISQTERNLATPPSASGTYIAFSADVGQLAEDGDGTNGTFTKHLLDTITAEGVKLNDVFKHVRKKVEEETDGKQSPASCDKTTGDFYFSLPKNETQILSETDTKTESKITLNISPNPDKILINGNFFKNGKYYKNGIYKIEISKNGYLEKSLKIDLKKRFRFKYWFGKKL
ncbi:hypothetical protein ThvES_00014190 [Thiovulum sp. ES]|nr:hypothetical protein ThvES_00014190 [Thiovulum sp. ES]